MVRVAINGFGRTGRSFVRAARHSPSNIEIVAVNDLVDPRSIVNLLQRDSVFGPYEGEVSRTPAGIAIDGNAVDLFAEAEPANRPWKQLGVDLVVEATGRRRRRLIPSGTG